MKPLTTITLLSAASCAFAAPTAERCTALAELASSITESKLSGIPQAAVASSLRAQYVEDTEEQREQNSQVERVIVLVYKLGKEPEKMYMTVMLKCKAGELSTAEVTRKVAK